MVKTVGVYVAKTHFSQLLKVAGNGATSVITKLGVPLILDS